jgi:nitrogen fixation-related uncharacterized protein
MSLNRDGDGKDLGMRTKMRIGRILFVLGTAAAVLAPTSAFAHDNLGGDELAVANWMLIAAVFVAMLGGLAMVWAAMSGQFSNIEDSKYTMLDTAEDFDAIMAEADAEQERLRKLEVERAQAGKRTASSESAKESPQTVGAERPVGV